MKIFVGRFNLINLNLLILLVYGLFSSSTPDKFGFSELVIASSLVLVIAKLLPGFFDFNNKYIVIWIFCLISGLIAAILNGNNINSFFRDFIPFLYLIIPCLYMRFFKSFRFESIVFGLVVVGLAFSVRYFLIESVNLASVGKEIFFGDSNYFPLDPAVTFASCFLLIYGLLVLKSNIKLAFLSVVLGFFCYMALLGVLLRAPLILIALVFCVFFTKSKRGFFSLALLLSLSVLIYFKFDFFVNAYLLLVKKFSAVGLNSKDTEFKEILSVVSDSGLFSIIAGLGFGAEFFSSAAQAQVRFSHSFVAYNFLKFGFVGVLLFAVLLFKWLYALIGSFKNFSVPSDAIALAALYAGSVALLSSFFLQGSFKSLTFAYVLAVCYYSSIRLNRS